MTALAAATGAVPAWAAPPDNDTYAQRAPVVVGGTARSSESNLFAGIESDEPLTSNDQNGGQRCASDGSASSTGTRLINTVWWEFSGTGAAVTASTLGSRFDTVMAVYDTDGRAFLACNDDVGRGGSTDSSSSEVTVPTELGHRYAVQVGSCESRSTSQGCASQYGNVQLQLLGAPGNDLRESAQSVSDGTVSVSNRGATTEADDIAQCDGRPLAKTVWFRYHVSAAGSVTFTTSGLDTSLVVLRDSVQVACNDNRAAMDAASSVTTQVTPGDYLLEVGGAYDNGKQPSTAASGVFGLAIASSGAPATPPGTSGPSTPSPAGSPVPGASGQSPPPTDGSVPSAATKPVLKARLRNGFLYDRSKIRPIDRFTSLAIVGAPSGSKLVVRCAPVRKCPFRRPLKSRIHRSPYSLAALIKKHHQGLIGWGARLTFTVTKTGYAGRRLGVLIGSRGVPKRLKTVQLP